MKKVLFLILALLIVSSCCSSSSYNSELSKSEKRNKLKQQQDKELIESIERFYQTNCVLIELTLDGHTHQFVASKYRNAPVLTHWPSCEYCK